MADEGDISVAMVLDLGPLEAALKRAEGLVQGLAQTAAAANTAMAKKAEENAQAVVTLTDAEKTLAAELKKTKAAQEAAAAQLGITRAEYVRLQKQIEAQAAAEGKAAATVARLTEEQARAADEARAAAAEEARLAKVRDAAGATAQRLATEIRKEKEERQDLARAMGLNLTELKKLQKAETQLIAEQERVAASSLSVGEALDRSRMQIERKSRGLDIGTGKARSYHDTLSLVAETTGELDSTLKGLGGALGVANDSMDKALNKTGELFGGMEAGARITSLLEARLGLAAGALGPLALGAGLAAGAVVAMYSSFENAKGPIRDMEDALEAARLRTEAMATSVGSLRGALQSLREQTEDAQIGVLVAQGALTESEAQLSKAVTKTREGYNEQIKAQATLAASTQLLIERSEERRRSGDLNLQQVQAALAEEKRLKTVLEGQQKAVKDLRDERDLAVDALVAEADAVQRAADATDEDGAAKGRASTATRQYTKVTTEAEQAVAALAQRQADLAAAFEESFFADYLDGLDRALFGAEKLSRSQEKIGELVAATDELIPVETLDRADQLRLLLIQLETEGARMGVTLESALAAESFERTPLEDALVRINDELSAMDDQARVNQDAVIGTFEAIADAVDAATDAYIAAQGRKIAADRERLAEIKGLEDEASKEERKRLKASVREQKKAARAAFRVQQAGSIAQAIVAGVLAAQQALTLGPIAGPIAAAAIGITSAANVAAIASADPPQFRAGGRIQSTADSTAVPIIAHQGEHVVNTLGVAAAGGHEALDALNRGEPMGGGPTVVQLRVGDKVMEEVVVGGLTRTDKGREMSRSMRARGRVNVYEPGRL